uniref:Alpha-amylase /trypsin inhibitor n=1 Tax=Oryza sativa subsp. indica TaxID=39946 RepID=A0MLV4_ORYSI|nr:alpha-amylase /trypsin inhibitor [Oryza sativa Indica Group]
MHRRTRILLRLRGHICLRCPPPRAPPWPHPAHRLPSGRGEGDAGRCLPPAAQVKELKSGSGGEGRGGGVEEVEKKIRGRSLLLRCMHWRQSAPERFVVRERPIAMPGLQYIPALAAAGRMDRRMETERRRGGERRGEPLGSGPNGVGAGWRSGGRWRERRWWRRAEGAMTQWRAPPQPVARHRLPPRAPPLPVACRLPSNRIRRRRGRGRRRCRLCRARERDRDEREIETIRPMQLAWSVRPVWIGDGFFKKAGTYYLLLVEKERITP